MELLRVDSLTKRFKGHFAVAGISFSIEEGSCTALLGPNGAGKTTTIQMLTGLLKPTSGTICLFHQGQSVADRRPYIGYLPQTPSFYPWMTGLEFVRFAGELAGLTGEESKRRADEWLRIVGLTDASKRRIGGYSGGMKQRLGMAQALIHRPKLLILDEPVSALDPAGRRDVLNLLEQIRQETTVLFSTHVLHDAEEICDEIILMQHGQITERGDLAVIRNANSEPVITIEVDLDETSLSWLASLRTRVYVQHVEIGKGTGRFTVADMEHAQQDILADAIRRGIKLRKYEAGQSTLEDWFLKAVNA